MKNIRGTKRKYHYFYKITNKINGHFYYGVHNTDNINDGYMGSGVRLKYAYKKYGIECFEKEIIKYFNSAKEAFEYEAEIVTENLVKNSECYNVSLGGSNWGTLGTISVIDTKTGYGFRCLPNDPRYISGELITPTKGQVPVKDIYGNIFLIDKNDPRYISGEFISMFKDKISVKDKYNNYYSVDKNDQRYISGKLIPIWKNRKHKQESIQKQKDTYKKIHHQQGENNINYGTCWVMKENKSIRIPKDNLQKYLEDGWQKGRKCGNMQNYVNVNNGKEFKLINKNKLQEYLNNGWFRGIGKFEYTRLTSDL